VSYKVGGLPLPIYLLAAGLFFALAGTPTMRGGVEMTLALIPVATFFFVQIGRWLPAVRTLGLDIVLLMLVPALLVADGWIRPQALESLKYIFASCDIVGWFICILIFGSIMSIEWRTFIALSTQIVLPLIVASIAALAVGGIIGAMLGLGWLHSLFFIVAPILGGGVSAGAIPLATGYAAVQGTSEHANLAIILPSVILANLTAIILAALVQRGRPPDVDGLSSFRVVQSADDILPAKSLDNSGRRTVLHIGLGFIAVLTIYGTSLLLVRFLGWPSPLSILMIAVALNFTGLLPALVGDGVRIIYRASTRLLIYPMLFCIGLLFVSWGSVLAGLAPANLITVFVTVAALAAGGYFASKLADMPAVDAATIALTRAAMGGSGNVGILGAARRLEFMPFAQLSTRVGGASTVALALAAFTYFGR